MVAWDEFTSGMRMAAAREIKRPGTATIDLGPVVIIEPSGPSTYPALAGTAAGILGVWSTGGDTPAIAARTIPWQ
jgi:hypothetical protein